MINLGHQGDGVGGAVSGVGYLQCRKECETEVAAAEAFYAGDPSELLDGWSEIVTTGLHSLDDEVPAPLDEESIEQLRALGYAD